MHALAADLGAAFLIVNSLVENLPDQTTQTMGNRPDGLREAQARNQAPKHKLEVTPLGLDGRVGFLPGLNGFMSATLVPPQDAKYFGFNKL